MDKIYDTPMRPMITFREFLQECQENVNPELFFSSGDIKQYMKLSDEQFNRLEDECSLKHLEQNDDVPVTPYLPGCNETTRKTVSQVPEAAMKLKTVQSILHEKKTSIKNPFGRTQYSYRLVQEPEPPSSSDETCEPFTELLIYVRFYRPKRSYTRGGKPQYETPSFAEEFVCLGSNYLSELRDKISCVCNKKRFFDISETPETKTAHSESNPGFFFITDTFYNDTRDPANADYSEVIRNWSKRANGYSEMKFKTANMEETKFIDLTVSLGFPQVYQHHGNCEHLFTFAFVEYVTPSTVFYKKELYPLLKSVNCFNNRMCNMCGQREYIYLVMGCYRQIYNPAYLCTSCFLGFHYIDGKKIGNFQAYKLKDIHEDLENEPVQAQSEYDISVNECEMEFLNCNDTNQNSNDTNDVTSDFGEFTVEIKNEYTFSTNDKTESTQKNVD